VAEEPNVVAKVVSFLEALVEWIQENLGDPALAAMLREDLGLAEGADIPANQQNQLTTFAAGLDPDKAAFDETVTQIGDLVQALIQLGETLKGEQGSGWDVVYLLARIAGSESIRVRLPVVYALGKLVELVSDDPESIEELDPAVVMGLLRGDPPAIDGEVLLHRIHHLTWLLVTALETILEKVTDTDVIDAYHGWDPDPGSATPTADLVSARATTLMAGTGGDLDARLAMTLLGVPPEHRGPGLFLSFGGGLTAQHTEGDTTYRFQAGATGALDLYLPFPGSVQGFTAGGDPSGFVALDVLRGRPEQPAIRVGDPGRTRLDIGKLLFGVELGHDRAAFRAGLQDAALVLVLGDGDGFLAQLPGGEIRIELGLIVTADTRDGLRIEGGTRARATLPLNSSLFGVFTIYHLEVALGPSERGRDVAIELSGGFGLKLGPFRASVDRLGLLIDLAFKEGNLGLLDAELGFKPPNGLGLALDAGPVKGGGYLYVDPARNEYAGALELTFFSVSVKAIGLLSTKLPDGSPGWSLLLLIYGQFPPIQLSWGFTLSGVGGMIGLQHAVSIDALQSGMSSGVLDDILFPADPVGDAPRIINRLRTVFPATPRALTFGPMLEIGWGTPNIVLIRLGVVVQLDNAIGSGTGTVEFSRLVLLGQLLVQLPPKATGAPALLKLLVDILGYYDAAEARLGFIARLRDSKVAGLTLTGMLIVQADFGDQPSFVMAAGGFHPRFTDVPPGLPAKIDRLGVKFDIKMVKITIEGYFAVTPATVQTGASVNVKASLGPVSLEGWLGFDAIFYFQPRFHFEVDLRAGVRVKFKGHTLASVELTMTLWGPGLWRAKGKISFSILFWDVSKSFDVQTGSAPDTPEITTDVAGLLRSALSDEGSWAAQLPPAGASAASIGPVDGIDGLLAHPLGQLQLVQTVVPLGLDIQRFGTTRVAGATRFDLTEVRLGDQSVTAPAPLTQPFARSQFVDMSADEKLTRPSFEQLQAGVAVGTDHYRVPADQVRGDLDYETHILEPPQPGLRLGTLVLAELVTRHVAIDELSWQAKLGAVGAAAVHATDRMQPATSARIEVTTAPLAIAGTDDLAAAAASLAGGAVHSTLAAEQAIAGHPDVRLVEAYELLV
jgi:hypothetical protein